MKALTIQQPWATLVAIGAKRIETRSWRTSYRGPLAIHAAKGFPKWARQFTTAPVCYETVRRFTAAQGSGTFPAYPTGVVLATCTLVDCVPIRGVEPVSELERAFGDYSDGRYAWMLANVVPLPTPISAKGALGLWEWEPALEVKG